MPFYKKLKEFKEIFPKNYPFFRKNGVEVIISMDDFTEEEALLDFISNYHEINWKVIVNRKDHEWRNPAKAINVGIRFATKKYVFVCSPESELVTDVIYIMRRTLYYYPNHFTVGYIDFKSYDNNKVYASSVPYGSIMVERNYLVDINGYDESILNWGGDDDNIRSRLELLGLKKMLLPDARMVHWESSEELGKRSGKRNLESRPCFVEKNIFFPDHYIVNSGNWGRDFNTVVYDWQNKTIERNRIKEFLERFLKYDLKIEKVNNMFSNILLVQCHNEKKRIPDFINKNSKFFDAIIFLDDESEDGSYDYINHDKLLLKVQKARSTFNDLENRNILLSLVSFFNTDWIVFLDIDEIIDERFSDFSFVDNPHISVVGLQLIHLWNDENFYNKDYPYSKKGIQVHYRMFRNIGYSQILTNKRGLHFPLVPYIKDKFYSNVLIKHYGHLDKVTRERKFIFYNKVDRFKDQEDYSHFNNHNPALGNIKEISPDYFN